MRLGADQQVVLAFDLVRLHLLAVFFDALQALLDLSEIVHDEVEVDVFDVAQGVDGPDVSNRVVLEDAHHVRQRVDVAQVGGEGGLVQRLFGERGHVGVLDAGVNQLLGVVECSQAVEAIVGNAGDAEMGLARIAAALRHLLLGQHDKERSFAYLRQADDAGFHRKQLAVSS